MTKTSSLKSAIDDLLNTAPTDFDPEDEEISLPHVTSGQEKDLYGEDDQISGAPSLLRQKADKLRVEDELSSQYKGTVVSRKDLEFSDSDSEDNASSEESDNSINDKEPTKKPQPTKLRTKSTLVTESTDNNLENEEFSDSSSSEEEELDSKMDVTNDETPEGKSGDLELGLFKHQEEILEKQLNELKKEDDILLSKPSKSSNEEFQKAKAVRVQCSLWDDALDLRIRTQQILKSSNQLPTPETYKKFCTSSKIKRKFSQLHESTSQLMENMFELQQVLFDKNDSIPEQQPFKKPKIDSEKDSKDLVQTTSQYWEHAQKGFSSFLPFSNDVIERWNRKTQLVSGAAIKARKFKALHQSTLTQIDSILADKERLLKRSQTNRQNCKIIGDSNSTEEYLTEIYDDGDFYEQLLKDLINNESESVPNDSSGVQLPKRKKAKKSVDTKASKGRKIRYTVQPKLMNFMAPTIDVMEDAHNELFSSLFGS